MGFIGSLRVYLLDITKILEQKAIKSVQNEDNSTSKFLQFNEQQYVNLPLITALFARLSKFADTRLVNGIWLVMNFKETADYMYFIKVVFHQKTHNNILIFYSINDICFPFLINYLWKRYILYSAAFRLEQVADFINFYARFTVLMSSGSILSSFFTH